MIEPSIVPAATPIVTYGGPIAVIIGLLTGISGAAFGVYQKINPILEQNKRDRGLNVDYDAQRKEKKELEDYKKVLEADLATKQSSYDQLIAHVIKLKAHVVSLTDAVTQLSQNVDSLCSLATITLANLPNSDVSDVFVGVLNTTKEHAINTKTRALDAATLANFEITSIDNHVAKHNLGPG